ncbi:MAG: hypothetical protein AAFO94_03910 [Bacteroidota bacterium]
MVQVRTDVANPMVEPLRRATSDTNPASIIKKHTLFSMATGLIPIDALGVAANAGVQVSMLKQLCDFHGVDFNDEMATAIIHSFLGAVATKLTAVGVQKTFGAFTAFGSFGETLSYAAIAGFLTAASGEVYQQHFLKGGSLKDLEMMQFVDYLQEKVESGELSFSTFTNPRKAFAFLQ